MTDARKLLRALHEDTDTKSLTVSQQFRAATDCLSNIGQICTRERRKLEALAKTDANEYKMNGGDGRVKLLSEIRDTVDRHTQELRGLHRRILPLTSIANARKD